MPLDTRIENRTVYDEGLGSVEDSYGGPEDKFAFNVVVEDLIPNEPRHESRPYETPSSIWNEVCAYDMTIDL